MMPLICTECPNKTEFKRLRCGFEDYEETEVLDENENNVDYVDNNIVNSECTDIGDITCRKCDSKNVEDVSVVAWINHNAEKLETESWADYYKRKEE